MHTPAASTMDAHIDASGGLVSNPSDREIQGSSALAAHAAALDLDVGNFSWDEPHVAKRDIGQLSDRKLISNSSGMRICEGHAAVLEQAHIIFRQNMVLCQENVVNHYVSEGMSQK